MNNVSLFCNVYVPLIECWKYKLLMKLCDTWIERWNCGINLWEVYVVDDHILQWICARDGILKYMLLMNICAIMIKCEYVLLRLCPVFLLMRRWAIWIEKWIEVVELSPCLGENCELWLWWDWIEMMIKGSCDEMWNYE